MNASSLGYRLLLALGLIGFALSTCTHTVEKPVKYIKPVKMVKV